jgi:glycosyltransferase involved in cell wall biosynthesis
VRILGFGTYDTERHPRVGIILDGLRSHGVAVVEVTAPLRVSTADRVAMLKRPWTALRLVPLMVSSWWSIVRQARRAGRSGGWDAVIVGYLGHFDVIVARLAFPRTTVVLDHLIFAADTARDRGMDTSVRTKALGYLDGLAIRCADIVVVDTDEHAALVAASQRHKVEVVKVGASAEWFRAAEQLRPVVATAAADTPLRIVFFGLFTPLQGATVIGEALDHLHGRTDLTATLIGTGQDHASVRSTVGGDSRVTWLDWVGIDELPAMVAGHDVCLGIFGTGPKAQRVIPNKVYQGAAAGCAVVTSDTPPQRRLLGDAAVLVPPGDAGALAGTLARLAEDRAEVRSLREAMHHLAVGHFSGPEVVIPLLDRLRAR